MRIRKFTRSLIAAHAFSVVAVARCISYGTEQVLYVACLKYLIMLLEDAGLGVVSTYLQIYDKGRGTKVDGQPVRHCGLHIKY